MVDAPLPKHGDHLHSSPRLGDAAPRLSAVRDRGAADTGREQAGAAAAPRPATARADPGPAHAQHMRSRTASANGTARPGDRPARRRRESRISESTLWSPVHRRARLVRTRTPTKPLYIVARWHVRPGRPEQQSKAPTKPLYTVARWHVRPGRPEPRSKAPTKPLYKACHRALVPVVARWHVRPGRPEQRSKAPTGPRYDVAAARAAWA